MNDIPLFIALTGAIFVALIALVSRHHLRVRHVAAKSTLQRVVRERDEARWKLTNQDNES